MLEPGSNFESKYTILSHIGSGGMADVYLARHETLSEMVVVKLLRFSGANAEIQLRRFQHEAQVMTKIAHKNVVRCLSFGITADGQQPYLIMEHLEGASLDSVLKRAGALPLDRTVNLLTQVCAGLHAVHQAGVIHRDLKPSNIMLLSDETVKVIDFGIAKLEESEKRQDFTGAGAVSGSPLYMSPERCTGVAEDRRTDIYSLGCIMYECLTGKPPFESDNVLLLMSKHINDSVALQELEDRISPHAIKIVERCMRKNAEERYPDAKAVLVDLEKVDPAEPVKTKRILPMFVCISAVVALAVIAGSMLYHRHSGDLPIQKISSESTDRRQGEPAAEKLKKLEQSLDKGTLVDRAKKHQECYALAQQANNQKAQEWHKQRCLNLLTMQISHLHGAAKARLLRIRGESAMQMNDQDTAVEALQESLRITPAENHIERSRCLKNLASLCRLSGNYSKALALSLQRKDQEQTKDCWLFLEITHDSLMIHDLAQSARYAALAFQLLKTQPYPPAECFTLWTELGSAFLELDDSARADLCYEEALKIAPALTEPYVPEQIVQIALKHVECFRKDKKKQFELVDTAINTIETWPRKNIDTSCYLGRLLLQKGLLCIRAGDSNCANDCFNKITSITTSNELVQQAARQFIRSYIDSSQYDRAEQIGDQALKYARERNLRGPTLAIFQNLRTFSLLGSQRQKDLHVPPSLPNARPQFIAAFDKANRETMTDPGIALQLLLHTCAPLASNPSEQNMLRLAKANMYLQRGIRAKKSNNRIDAEKDLRSALELVATDSSAFALYVTAEADQRLAGVMSGEKRFTEATSLYEQALKIHSEQPESDERALSVAACLTGLGKIYLVLKDESKARQCFSKVEQISARLPCAGAQDLHILNALADYQKSINSPAEEDTRKKIELQKLLRETPVKRGGS